jgi:hypothetical protein
MAGRPRTVLEYGLADWSPAHARDPGAMAMVEAESRRVNEAYEPRLREFRVKAEPVTVRDREVRLMVDAVLTVEAAGASRCRFQRWVERESHAAHSYRLTSISDHDGLGDIAMLDFNLKRITFPAKANSILNGKYVIKSDLEVHRDSVFGLFRLMDITTMPYQEQGRMSVDEVDLAVGAINCFRLARTMTSRAKEKAVFRSLYQHGRRKLRYIRGIGAPVDGEDEDTFPCMQCGLLLPERLIEVDHQRPVEGGTTEAIAKVFRALGLTNAGSSGVKGRILGEVSKSSKLQFGATVSGVVPGAVPTRMNQASVHFSSLDNRYTLNAKGIILITIIQAAGMYSMLEEVCLHSIVNAAPLCGYCNKEKGKRTKYP